MAGIWEKTVPVTSSPAGGLYAPSGLNRRDWLIAFTLFFFCLAIRTVAAVRVDFSADEGVVGLMALDILAGKAPTCYWYGQQYMGTLENILAAPFIALLGPTAAAVRAPSVVGGAAAVFLVYLYLVRYRSRMAALSAAVLLAVSPAFFHDICIRARGGYGVTLPLAAGMLWAASGKGRLRFSGGLLFGLLAGASFWTNLQTLEVSLPLAVYLVVWRRRAGGLAGGIVGFVTGILPVIGHWFSTGVFLRTPPAHLGGTGAALAALAARSVAVFGGGAAVASPVKAATGTVVLVFLGVGLVLYVLQRRRESGGRALDALVTTPFLGAALLVANGSAYAPQRYYYLVYFALVIAGCAGWGAVRRRTVAVAALAAAVAANAVGMGLYHWHRPFDEEYLSMREYAGVIGVLNEQGISSVVTDYGVDYSLMYLSGLRLKAVPVPLGGKWCTRYASALGDVRDSDRFAVVLYDQPSHERLKDHMKPAVFEKFLSTIGRRYRRFRLGRIVVYTDIERMNTASDMEEYGRWALERFPTLNELSVSIQDGSAGGP